jgi:hypothetical protein
MFAVWSYTRKIRERQVADQGPYNDGFTHEALHTTHVLLSTFDAHVLESRCAAEFPDVKAAAKKAHQAMFDLYQLIGEKFVDDPPTHS